MPSKHHEPLIPWPGLLISIAIVIMLLLLAFNLETGTRRSREQQEQFASCMATLSHTRQDCIRAK